MLAPVRLDRNFFCRFGDLIFPMCARREGRPRLTAKLRFSIALLFLGVAASCAYASPVTLPGVTAIGSTSAVQTVSVVVTANGQLGKVSALTGGVSNLDFAISGAGTCLTGSALVVGQTCSFPVTFSP